MKFSDTDGIIQVWREGTKVVDFRGDNHQVEKHEGTYLKFGIYSSQYEKNPLKGKTKRTVYHDELRIAGSEGSYDLVAPRGSKPSEDNKSEQADATNRLPAAPRK